MTEAHHTTLPELPEGWRTVPPEDETDSAASVYARGWSVLVQRDGDTSLTVQLADGDACSAQVTIHAMWGFSDPEEYVLDVYRETCGRFALVAGCVPTMPDVRLALDWCRAALEATS